MRNSLSSFRSGPSLRRIAGALVVAAMMGGVAANPAFAAPDRSHHDRGHDRGRDRDRGHDHDWRRDWHGSYYNNCCWSGPPPYGSYGYYGAPPGVYVPLPSVGFSLTFP